MGQILNIFSCLISFVGIVSSITLLIEGSQPCGGDGCLIHILLIIGVIMLLISAPIFFFTLRREVLRYKAKRPEL